MHDIKSTLVFIESVAKVGIIKTMTLVPMKIGVKLWID
jgi:hypothetical protein